MIATRPAFRQQDGMSATIPAATVVIVRDLADGYEVLMIERHSQLAFAGGAVVFPGGRVDEDDRRLAAMPEIGRRDAELDPDDAAGRIAAIRESLEETGIGVGIEGLAMDQWAAWRDALNQGAHFSELLLSHGAWLNLEALTPFARWLPSFRSIRTFDTRFYLAKAPAAIPPLGDADGSETIRLFWASPQQVIADADKGTARVIFPTRRNLERLAVFQNYAALDSHARQTEVRTITPWVEEFEGDRWLTIPDDLGYPITRELLENAMRG